MTQTNVLAVDLAEDASSLLKRVKAIGVIWESKLDLGHWLESIEYFVDDIHSLNSADGGAPDALGVTIMRDDKRAAMIGIDPGAESDLEHIVLHELMHVFTNAASDDSHSPEEHAVDQLSLALLDLERVKARVAAARAIAKAHFFTCGHAGAIEACPACQLQQTLGEILDEVR